MRAQAPRHGRVRYIGEYSTACVCGAPEDDADDAEGGEDEEEEYEARDARLDSIAAAVAASGAAVMTAQRASEDETRR